MPSAGLMIEYYSNHQCSHRFRRGNRHSFVKYDATAIVSFTSFTGNIKDSPDYINLPYCKRFDLKKENKTKQKFMLLKCFTKCLP